LHAAMVLLHHIIEIADLADGDRGAVVVIIPPDGRLLVPRLRQDKVNGLSHLIHGAIKVAPLASDSHGHG